MTSGETNGTKRLPGDRPTTDDRRPTTDNRRPTTDDRRPTYRRPTTDDRRPTTDDRRPTTDNRRPTTDDRRPTMAVKVKVTRGEKVTTRVTQIEIDGGRHVRPCYRSKPMTSVVMTA
jgi:hypothetical protein